MDFAKNYSRISHSGRALKSQEGTPSGANQSEKPIKRHVVTQNLLGRDGPCLGFEELQKLRSRSAFGDQKGFSPQLAPMDDILPPKWMALWKSDDHSLAPDGERPVVPNRFVPSRENDVDPKVREGCDEMILRAIDQAHHDLGMTTAVLDKCRSEVSGRERRMNAQSQSSSLAICVSVETNRDRLDVSDDSPGDVEEFAPHRRRSGSAIGALEQFHTKPIFQFTQPST